jgi:hypothetical protein
MSSGFGKSSQHATNRANGCKQIAGRQRDLFYVRCAICLFRALRVDSILPLARFGVPTEIDRNRQIAHGVCDRTLQGSADGVHGPRSRKTTRF